MSRPILAWALGAVIWATTAGIPPALAQDGFYVGIRGIGSLGEVDVSSSGFGGAESVDNDDDHVIGVGAIVGYRWQDIPLRTEIEGGYRFRFDMDVRDSGPPTVDYETNIATTTVLLNAYLEWRNESDFTPFVGGTIGWARNAAENKRTVLGASVSQSDDADEDNLAWGVAAGVDWLFLENVSAELAYRFINLGDVDGGSFAGGDSVEAEDYISHDVMLSVSYRF